jgi:hypothetical protein
VQDVPGVEEVRGALREVPAQREVRRARGGARAVPVLRRSHRAGGGRGLRRLVRGVPARGRVEAVLEVPRVQAGALRLLREAERVPLLPAAERRPEPLGDLRGRVADSARPLDVDRRAWYTKTMNDSERYFFQNPNTGWPMVLLEEAGRATVKPEVDVGDPGKDDLDDAKEFSRKVRGMDVHDAARYLHDRCGAKDIL